MAKPFVALKTREKIVFLDAHEARITQTRTPHTHDALTMLMQPLTRSLLLCFLCLFLCAQVAPTLLAHFDAASLPREYGGAGELRPIDGGALPWEGGSTVRRRRY